ncbi:hypothetical protein ECEC1862_1678, partial [Escherichia coli EC1862]
LEVCMAIMFVR